jgi:hypothetical protein
MAASAIEAAVALAGLMARKAFGPVPGGALRCGGRRMGIVTSPAPKAISRGALTGAFGQLLYVAVDLEAIGIYGHENGDKIR